METKQEKSLRDRLLDIAVSVGLFTLQAVVVKWGWGFAVEPLFGLGPVSIAQAMALMVVGRALTNH